MTVNFTTANANPKIGYVPTVTVANAVSNPAPTKNEVIKADTLEMEDAKKDKKEKKGFISSVSSGLGSIKKFFASASEYTKGFFKGITGGVVAGSLVYTASNVLKSIKKKPKTKGTVVLSVLAGAAAFVYNMYKAYLNSNNATAQIDHRYR